MFQVAILSTGTLAFLAIAFVGIGLVAYLTYNYPGRVFHVFFLAIASVSILSTLLAGRVLRLGDSGLEQYLEGGAGGSFAGKVLLLILVGIAFSICVAWWLWRLRRDKPTLRYSAVGTTELKKLTWATVFYFAAFSLIPLALAPKWAFHVSLLYPVFVWLALLLALRISSVDPLYVIRQVLGLIVVSSLVAAVLLPSVALQPGYTSLIPGFSMRLWGATASANTLGSVAASLLVLQFAERTRRTVFHSLLTLCAFIALVMTQSKTAMAGALVGLSVLFFWRFWTGNPYRRENRRRIIGAWAVVFLLGAVLVGTIWVGLHDPVILSAIERRLDPHAVSDLGTLTGRIQIWQYAFRRGLESPWFGHGLSMWDLQVRLDTGLSGAVHAHNQFLQAFSRAGFVGLIALLVLLWFVIRNALDATRASTGVSLALLAMFLLRSLTEVPIQPNSILGGEFFAFLALVAYATDRAFRRGELKEGEAGFECRKGVVDLRPPDDRANSMVPSK
jgi:exopolysaccharide production protein ExoQ